MSIIKAISAILPEKSQVSSFTVSALHVADKNDKFSFNHIQNPELYEQLKSPIDIAKSAQKHIQKALAEKLLQPQEKPCLFLYRIKNKNHEQTGIVCHTAIDDIEKGLIKLHETTRTEKEDIIKTHIRETGFQANPVILTYESRRDINDYVEKLKFVLDPLFEVNDESGYKHTLWKLENEKFINDIGELFENVDALYVADGHHRCAASVKIKDLLNNNLFSVLFPHDQLRTLEFNRLIKTLNGHTPQSLINEISKDFFVDVSIEPFSPKSNLRFGMYLNGAWYSLGFKKPERLLGCNWVEKLNVTILQENLLSPILGIKDARNSHDIEFINGTFGLKYLQEQVDDGRFKAAFSLAPVSVNEIMRIADEKLFMPPKSTWFDPKLRSGLVSAKV